MTWLFMNDLPYTNSYLGSDYYQLVLIYRWDRFAHCLSVSSMHFLCVREVRSSIPGQANQEQNSANLLHSAANVTKEYRLTVKARNVNWCITWHTDYSQVDLALASGWGLWWEISALAIFYNEDAKNLALMIYNVFESELNE